MGYLTQWDPDPWHSRGQVSFLEHDTFTCNHCGKVVKLVYGDPPPNRVAFEVNVKSVSGCVHCGEYVCNDPICRERTRRFGCDPVEEKLRRAERRK